MKKTTLFLVMLMMGLIGCGNRNDSIKTKSNPSIYSSENYIDSIKESTEGNFPTFPKEPPKIKLFDNSVANNTKLWNTLYGHDPAVFKDEKSGYYYIYSTDVGSAAKPGAQIRRSKDLINFEYIGPALQEGVPKEPKDYTKAQGIWAPDIIKVGDEYRLYYSTSTFGSQNSAISLAVSKSPEGPFIHKGIVIKSKTGDPINTIDANIVVENNTGDHYMVYGSFWRGISIIKLDKKTGLAAEDGFGKRIATRPSYVDGAIEGPYIRYNPQTGYYYLFVSYGSLFSDYNVRVGRSKNITGPYVDYNGVELTNLTVNANDVGLKITTGYRFGKSTGWMALGHNSVLNDNGNWFMVNHARPETSSNWPYMQVRIIVWSEDGWPLVSPSMYAGETLQKIDKNRIPGTYERIRFENNPKSNVTASVKMYFKDDSTCMIDDTIGKWRLEGDNTLIVEYGSITEKYTVIPSWDWENWKPTLAVTGIDNKGICIWGKKV